jgi:DNA (cytosine-5)-methyltransferase 1
MVDAFSGIGGFSLALGPVARTVAYIDNNPGANAVLASQIQKGALDAAPILQDITTVSKRHLPVDRIDIVTAGFPCQDISALNPNGRGLSGERSGLFFE